MHFEIFCKRKGNRTFNMAAKNHQDAFTRCRMVGKLEEGASLTRVAQEFEIDKSLVSRAWNAFQRASTVLRKDCGNL